MNRRYNLSAYLVVFCTYCGLFSAFFSLGIARGQVPTGNGVVATIGDESITLDDLRQAEQRLRRYGADQDKRELLQPFIDREILYLEATQAGLANVPKVLQTLDKIRRRQLAEKVYTEEVTKKVSVSEEEIRQYFVEYGLDQKHEVRASHILVDTEPEAQSVLQRLAIGEDFSLLAAEVSRDTATVSKGGDVGYWQLEDARKSDFVQHFIDLEVGDISSPYRNARGAYHLIKVTEHRLLGYERQHLQIKRTLERRRYKERWMEYLEEEQQRFRLAIDGDGLRILLDRGRFAEDKMPSIDPANHSQVLVRYEGGRLDLGGYLEMLKGTSIKDRPRSVDSTEVVRFAEREVMRDKVLTIVAEEKGWHRAEDIVAYMDEKRAQAMVEMLRRIKVEDPILTPEVRRAYYEDHKPDFLQSERVFFEGGLLGSVEEAVRVMEQMRKGDELASIMKSYPAFSDQWRKYDVFNFSTSGTASHGARWAKAVETVQNLKSGEMGGPVKLDFGEGRNGYLVVRSLMVRPARVLPYDAPLVQKEVRRKTRFEHRDEINRAFYNYLEEIRQKYDPSVVVYDHVLETLGQEIR